MKNLAHCNLQDVEQHISTKTAKDVADICYPLFKTFGLNYFSYAKKYKDNSVCYLDTNPLMKIFYFKQGVHKKFNNIPPPGNHLMYTYYNTNEYGKRHVNLLKQQFDYHYIYTIIIKHDDYLERLLFTAPSNNSAILTLYLNGKEVFNQFKLYFKERAASLINLADKNRFVHNLPVSNSQHLDLSNSYKDFLEKIKPKKVFLHYNSKDVVITRREYECIYHLAQGKTMKEVAQDLNISARTIESYLRTAKNKTGCYKKSQLTKIIL